MNITVYSTRGKNVFSFTEDLTVAEAAKQAAQAFNFPIDRRYDLLLSCNATTPLHPDSTLGSYDIHNGSTLFLTLASSDVSAQ
jgi:hypothetical protein